MVQKHSQIFDILTVPVVEWDIPKEDALVTVTMLQPLQSRAWTKNTTASYGEYRKCLNEPYCSKYIITTQVYYRRNFP